MKTKSAVSDFKRLAGMESGFEDWRRESPIVESAEEDSGIFVISRARARIRRMANLLSEDRLGGTHELTFDWDLIEQLMEAAASSSAHSDAARHHWNARNASAHAHETDKKGDSKASFQKHKDASQLHRNASVMLSKAGDHKNARIHSQWAQHHDRHASYHQSKARKADDAAKAKAKSEPAKKGGYEVHKDPFKKGSDDDKKAHAKAALDKLDKARDHHDKTAHMPAPTKPTRTRTSKVSKGEVWGHAAAAMTKDKSISHKDLADTHHKAHRFHLADVVKHAKAGDHEKALAHLHAAIHHAKKRDEHHDTGMKMKKGPAPAGPRAATGRTGAH